MVRFFCNYREMHRCEVTCLSFIAYLLSSHNGYFVISFLLSICSHSLSPVCSLSKYFIMSTPWKLFWCIAHQRESLIIWRPPKTLSEFFNFFLDFHNNILTWKDNDDLLKDAAVMLFGWKFNTQCGWKPWKTIPLLISVVWLWHFLSTLSCVPSVSFCKSVKVRMCPYFSPIAFKC